MIEHDLLVIGAGPGGYVAAIRAAQLGMNVACVDKEEMLGGTCLRVGCIPSKALLDVTERYEDAKDHFPEYGININGLSFDLPAIIQRKNTIVETMTNGINLLFKKNKITRYHGTGTFESANTVKVKGPEIDESITAKHIIIATGSKVATIPGVELNGEYIVSSTEAQSFTEVPEHLVIIGAGIIGLELGSVWRRLGSKVTVLEYLNRIMPGADGGVARLGLRLFKGQGFDIQLSKRVTKTSVANGKVIVECEGENPIECDKALVAVGRIPNTDGLGLENIGISTGDRGIIPINDRFETSVPGVYAIGDVVRGLMLAHKAEEEGMACVEMIATGTGHVNYEVIPSVCYTHPEIAWVGKTEEQLKEEEVAYSKGTFFFRANGRAHAMGYTEGNVKILAEKESGKVLGVHIVGLCAGDLIAEACLAMEQGATAEDIARTCHAHPTLPEVVKEAAMDVSKRAIHS